MAKRTPHTDGTPPPKPVRALKTRPTASVTPRIDSAADAPSTIASEMPAPDRILAGTPEFAPVLPPALPQSDALPQTAAAGPSDDEIRTRAYHRFLARGANHGQDWDDWLAAELELRKP